MAKIDLHNAFRLCPIRKQDWHLLGVTLSRRFLHSWGKTVNTLASKANRKC